MDSSDNDEPQFCKKSKKYNKKGFNIPLQELGFKPKLIPNVLDHRNIRTLKRGRKKKKYIPKSSKQIFLSHLRMVVDANDLPSDKNHNFQVNKLTHWIYVKKVYYQSHENIFCNICLEEIITAPQITFCGHIFCFHCILMHFKKSQNNMVCPVCKQYTQQSELKTCQPIFVAKIKVQDELTFNLKYRVGSIIYNSETLLEDILFNQIIWMRNAAIVSIFEKQQNQIMAELENISKTDRNHHYLTVALELTRKKLQSSINSMHQSKKLNLQTNQKIIDNVIYSLCDPAKIKNSEKFYQQATGRKIYLHSSCSKYLQEHCYNNKQSPPLKIKSYILEQQTEQFDPEIALEYRQLSHLLLGQDFDIAIISMKNLLDNKENEKFQQNFKAYLKSKDVRRDKEDAEALIRNSIFEEEQSYKRSLQKMAYCQFYDINAPTVMDPSQMNEKSFPSLISQQSQDFPGLQMKQRHESKVQEPKKSINNFNIAENSEDFPDLASQLKSVKSQVVQKVSGKNRKRKKEKRIDITAQLFASHQQDFQNY